MELIGQGIVQALRLLLSGDAEVWRIAGLSLAISATATLISLAVGIPLGTLLGPCRPSFRNRLKYVFKLWPPLFKSSDEPR